MKYVVISALSLFLFCACATNQTPTEPTDTPDRNVSSSSPFIGRFRPENCNAFGESKRVYSKVEKVRMDVPQDLVFSGYGEDAHSILIPLGSGQRQCDGTSVNTHGKCTQKWRTIENDQSLVFYEETDMPHRKINYSQEVTITVVPDGLQMNSKISGNNAQDKYNCHLVSY